jgi:hypothetical protein
MGKNLAQQLIAGHLVEGRMEVGAEIGLKIDQTLTQDATGTLVMLELEASMSITTCCKRILKTPMTTSFCVVPVSGSVSGTAGRGTG